MSRVIQHFVIQSNPEAKIKQLIITFKTPLGSKFRNAKDNIHSRTLSPSF